MNTAPSTPTARRFQPSHRAVFSGCSWIGNATKRPTWLGARPDGNPSAPRHATYVSVYGERLLSLGDREITLARYHQAHRSCRRRLCFALPLIVQTSAVGTNLKPLLITMSDKIRSYAELRELIRLSLRAQHPEWIEPNGDSPVCDSYEARFAELLGLTRSREEAKTSI
jgi:hypothetical protein